MIADPLTLTATDYEWNEETDTALVPEFSGSEIYEAIGSNSLTPEMCVYLHEQGVNWEIKVGGVQ